MADDPLKQPRLELMTAAKALADMRSAKSLVEFEMEWRICLNQLEKAWQRTERCCLHVRTQLESWQGQFYKPPKKYMLLRYLKQSRDANAHSARDHTKLQPGSRGYIKHMKIRNGGVIHYEDDPMIVGETPPHPIAVPVKNHGERFNPPTSHLGQAISTPLQPCWRSSASGFIQNIWTKFKRNSLALSSNRSVEKDAPFGTRLC